MDADYACTLNPDDLTRARSELNEDPRNRLGAVRKLREWIDEQPHIKFPTGKILPCNVIYSFLEKKTVEI